MTRSDGSSGGAKRTAGIGPILRQVDLANGLTLVGLSLGFLTGLFAIRRQFYVAALCMLYAGVVDMFDGFLAARLSRGALQAGAGKQLDSLVDVCAFGFAPAVFAYCFGFRDVASVILLLAFLGAGALRLAYFNAAGLSIEGGTRYYTGLPVTYVALFVPLVFAAGFVLPAEAMQAALRGLYLLLACAMVSRIRVPKVRGVWYCVFSLGALALTGLYLWAVNGGK